MNSQRDDKSLLPAALLEFPSVASQYLGNLSESFYQTELSSMSAKEILRSFKKEKLPVVYRHIFSNDVQQALLAIQAIIDGPGYISMLKGSPILKVNIAEKEEWQELPIKIRAKIVQGILGAFLTMEQQFSNHGALYKARALFMSRIGDIGNNEYFDIEKEKYIEMQKQKVEEKRNFFAEKKQFEKSGKQESEELNPEKEEKNSAGEEKNSEEVNQKFNEEKQKFNAKYKTTLKAMNMQFQKDPIGFQVIPEQWANMYLLLALDAVKSGNPILTKKYMTKALKVCPGHKETLNLWEFCYPKVTSCEEKKEGQNGVKEKSRPVVEEEIWDDEQSHGDGFSVNGYEDELEPLPKEEEDLFVNNVDSCSDESDTEAELFNSPSSFRYSGVVKKVGFLANASNPSRQDLSKGKSRSLISK